MLKKGICFPLSLPFGLKVSELKCHGKCRWKLPESVNVFGYWRMNTREDVFIDMNVVMSKVILLYF